MLVRIGRARIETEVVKDPIRQSLGLMFRKRLGKNRGMLFDFPIEFYHGIWMFGMRFPIDIIWIDKKMRVVDIVENAKPCLLFCRTYYPRKMAKYVLEVNSGFARKNKIKIDDKVVYSSR
jgi:uncharacterized membrane protein (UPF0127 family)